MATVTGCHADFGIGARHILSVIESLGLIQTEVFSFGQQSGADQ